MSCLLAGFHCSLSVSRFLSYRLEASGRSGGILVFIPKLWVWSVISFCGLPDLLCHSKLAFKCFILCSALQSSSLPQASSALFCFLLFLFVCFWFTPISLVCNVNDLNDSCLLVVLTGTSVTMSWQPYRRWALPPLTSSLSFCK